MLIYASPREDKKQGEGARRGIVEIRGHSASFFLLFFLSVAKKFVVTRDEKFRTIIIIIIINIS